MDWLAQILQQQQQGQGLTPGMGITQDNANWTQPEVQPIASGISATGSEGPATANAQATPPVSQGSSLSDLLRGVQAPKPPDVVKPSTPALPHQGQIQSGEFLKLLQALSLPRQPMFTPIQGRTLGQNLGTGRY